MAGVTTCDHRSAIGLAAELHPEANWLSHDDDHRWWTLLDIEPITLWHQIPQEGWGDREPQE
jgi:hypothetical protein